MLIGYRRFSGKIGISLAETGTRGMWWDKRIALMRLLQGRGHRLVPLSSPTRFTQELFPEWKPSPGLRVELLMVEFGGTNPRFFGEDINETWGIVHRHKGPVVYLCDDPDLWPTWGDAGEEDWGRWRIWVNARRPQEITGIPPGVQVVDFSFGALLPITPVNGGYTRHDLAYIGRPGGRSKVLDELDRAGVPVALYGRSKEWEGVSRIGSLELVGEPPPQPLRGQLYRKHIGALAIADSKHKRLGWRTGRAYHAISAGCPVLVETDHPGLQGMVSFSSGIWAKSVLESWIGSVSQRVHDWERECDVLSQERDHLLNTVLPGEGL